MNYKARVSASKVFSFLLLSVLTIVPSFAFAGSGGGTDPVGPSVGPINLGPEAETDPLNPTTSSWKQQRFLLTIAAASFVLATAYTTYLYLDSADLMPAFLSQDEGTPPDYSGKQARKLADKYKASHSKDFNRLTAENQQVILEDMMHRGELLGAVAYFMAIDDCCNAHRILTAESLFRDFDRETRTNIILYAPADWLVAFLSKLKGDNINWSLGQLLLNAPSQSRVAKFLNWIGCSWADPEGDFAKSYLCPQVGAKPSFLDHMMYFWALRKLVSSKESKIIEDKLIDAAVYLFETEKKSSKLLITSRTEFWPEMADLFAALAVKLSTTNQGRNLVNQLLADLHETNRKFFDFLLKTHRKTISGLIVQKTTNVEEKKEL